MNNGFIDQHAEVTQVQVTNQLARNTFTLLALSLIPTVLGSLLGISMDFTGSGWTYLIVFFVGMFGLQYLIAKNANSGLGVVFLLIFTFFMGFMLSATFNALFYYYSNAGMLIGLAAMGTIVTFGVTALVAQFAKTDFGQGLAGSSSSFAWGSFLGIGLGVLLVLMVGNLFFHSPLLNLVYCCIGVIVFSLFMLVDLQRVVRRTGNQNYVLVTLNLYMDLINVFMFLLNIFASTAGDRR